jgi:hypothetical protein
MVMQLAGKRVKQRVLNGLLIGSLLLAVPSLVFAQSLEQAAQQAARQYDAKVLSARTIKRNGQDIHEIKLLTKKGVVKTVHIPDRRQKKPD